MGRVISSTPILCEVHHGWETKWWYAVELEDGVEMFFDHNVEAVEAL